jgi:MFS family permease
MLGSLMMGVTLICNLVVHSVASIVVSTLFLGFFSGVFIALLPALFVALTNDKSKIGTRIGMGSALAGLGVLAGGPGGGVILGNIKTDLNWTGLWIYAGVVLLSGGAIFTILRIWKGGPKLMVKM